MGEPMKTRGRQPKPTALKIIQGNAGKRDLNENEPTPEHLDKAVAPDYLCDVAVKKWHEMVEILSRSCSRSSRIVMLSMLPATQTLKLNLKSRTV